MAEPDLPRRILPVEDDTPATGRARHRQVPSLSVPTRPAGATGRQVQESGRADPEGVDRPVADAISSDRPGPQARRADGDQVGTAGVEPGGLAGVDGDSGDLHGGRRVPEPDAVAARRGQQPAVRAVVHACRADRLGARRAVADHPVMQDAALPSLGHLPQPQPVAGHEGELARRPRSPRRTSRRSPVAAGRGPHPRAAWSRPTTARAGTRRRG